MRTTMNDTTPRHPSYHRRTTISPRGQPNNHERQHPSDVYIGTGHGHYGELLRVRHCSHAAGLNAFAYCLDTTTDLLNKLGELSGKSLHAVTVLCRKVATRTLGSRLSRNVFGTDHCRHTTTRPKPQRQQTLLTCSVLRFLSCLIGNLRPATAANMRPKYEPTPSLLSTP